MTDKDYRLIPKKPLDPKAETLLSTYFYDARKSMKKGQLAENSRRERASYQQVKTKLIKKKKRRKRHERNSSTNVQNNNQGNS